MAHKSREPMRRRRFRASRPHERGGEEIGPAPELPSPGTSYRDKNRVPGGTIDRRRRRLRLGRRGNAHHLIRRLTAEDLRSLSRP